MSKTTIKPVILIKGGFAMIYAKPLTRELPEGKAILIEKLDSGWLDKNSIVERWKVKFLIDDMTCERDIMVGNPQI